jgi:O-antigen/teichoic acid export membrane protein
MSTEANRTIDDSSQIKNLLTRSVLSSVGTKVLYLITRFFLPPLILAHVSLSEYGVWATCFIVIGYMGMGTFGVANAYVRYVAVYAARRDFDAINRLVSTGFTVVSALNVFLFLGVWLLLPHIMGLLDVSTELQDLARVLVLLTMGIFLLDQSLGFFNGVLEGLQRVPTTNAIWAAGFLLESVLIAILLFSGTGIYALAWAFLARYAFGVVASAVLCWRALPQLRLRPGYVDREMLGVLYRYAGVIQISGILSIMLRSAEKVLAGLLIGVPATALYEVGEKLPMMAAWVPTGIGAGFVPASSHLAASNRHEEIRKLYLKGCRYMSILTGMIVGFLAPFAGVVITAWLGPDEKYRDAALILAFFTLPYHLNVVTMSASAVYKGMGTPARELFYPLSQLAFVVVSVAIGLYTLGSTILMINICVASSMVLSALLYMLRTNRTLGIAQVEFARSVLLPGIVPYLIAAGLAQVVTPMFPEALNNRMDAFSVLAMSGLLYGITVPALVYRVFCDWGEREFLRRQFVHAALSFLPWRKQPTPAV